MRIQCPKCQDYIVLDDWVYFYLGIECPHCRTKWEVEIKLTEIVKKT